MAAAEHPVAQAHAPGPIHSYGGWAAWQDTTADGKRYVIRVRAPGGRVTTRPERARVQEGDSPIPVGIPFDLGPDAVGRPSIVVSVCEPAGAKCRIRIGRLPLMPSRLVGQTSQAARPATSVTLWRGRLAWTDREDDDDAVAMRFGPGLRPRILHPWRGRIPARQPKSYPSMRELELRGARLVSVIQYVDSRVGGNDAQKVGVQNVATGRRRTLATVGAGEGGQSILAPQFFDGRTLGWLTTCLGDSSGCSGPKWGFVRRDLRTAATRIVPDHHAHHGWAPIGPRAVLTGPETCGGDVTPYWECVIKERALGL
ncbi:hypothetical protein [Baekduia sp. Peel2402]|uniref:hypothetical protein n=1 Tax=Baekduia sp. Peel2402 TaxID=3458296 RepID=UPI00403EEFA2